MSPPRLGFGLTLSSLSVVGGKFSCLTVPAVERRLWQPGVGFGWQWHFGIRYCWFLAVAPQFPESPQSLKVPSLPLKGCGSGKLMWLR